jgi:cell shape-determining protein MreD
MRNDLRWLIVTGGNLLLMYLSLQVNHYLAYIPASLFLFGLPIGFAALRLTLGQGLATSAVTGLYYDTLTPFPFGIALVFFSITFTMIYTVRSRFHREETFSSIIAVLLANLFLFAAFCGVATTMTGTPGHPASLITDLLMSQVLIAIICGWFFAFQMAFLGIFGINIEEEQREAR